MKTLDRSRMDNVNPSPPKRPRTIDFLASQLEQPVRYFPFNKKSSTGSVILQQEKFTRCESAMTKQSQHVVSSSLSSTPFSSTMKFVPNKEVNISKKLQKLKLKSPDGRDLGEINVQLLPHKGGGIGGKTIMLQKHSLFGKLDNPSAVSILKPIEKNKQTTNNGPISVLQTKGGNFVGSENNSVAVNSVRMISALKDSVDLKPTSNVTNKRKIENQSTTIMRQTETIPKYLTSSVGSKVFYFNVDKQNGLNTVSPANNDVQNLTQTLSNQKIIVVHAENYPDSTEGKRNNCEGRPIELRISSPSKSDRGGATISLNSNVRTIPGVFWNPTKFPDTPSKPSIQKVETSENSVLVNKQMLVMRSPDSKYIETAGKSITLGSSNFNKKQKPKLNAWTIVRTCGEKMENGRNSFCKVEADVKSSPWHSTEVSKLSQGKTIIVSSSNTESTPNVTSTTNGVSNSFDSKEKEENMAADLDVENCKNKSNDNQNARENVMVIVPRDTNSLRNNSIAKNSDTETVGMETVRVGKAYSTNDGVQNKEIFNKNIVNPANSSSPHKQQDWDIIQKALSSCTDQELREKALKALAECGIGVKREVPITPVKSVNDSQTQTTVFSLLEPETFVESNENWPVLNRLNVINRNLDDLQHSNEIHTPSLHDLEMTNSDDGFHLSLDAPLSNEFTKVLDDFLAENSKEEVNQIRGIFSKPDPIVSKAFDQIQKDFQSATTMDADGMMGIHRAVLSGNIREVQRQLIVLKALKESIEVPTNDGRTSLELAVLHNVDRSIINVLLSAGARPAFPLKLHESALIIGCKTTSVVLPELIKYVMPSELLDIVDAEGFAPLHYCSQRGDYRGVKLLIKAGANVNLRDSKSGRTALFHALETLHIEIAWHLIDNGASPNITNFAGQSAATLVDEYRHNSLIEKLNQASR